MMHSQDIESCAICFEDKLENEMLNIRETKHSICINCFRDYLKAQITQNKVSNCFLMF